MKRLVALLCPALVCGAQGSTRDSAGVRIHDLRALRGHLPQIKLSASPIQQFSGSEHDSSTIRPTGAMRRMRDGRFIVQVGYQREPSVPGASRPAPVAELLLYDRDGTLLRRGGRAGRNPGELNTRTTLLGVLPGDSILVTTAGSPVQVFDPDLRYVRSYSMGPFRSIPQPRGMLADGTVIAAVPRPMAVAPDDTMRARISVLPQVNDLWAWRGGSPAAQLLPATATELVVRPPLNPRTMTGPTTPGVTGVVGIMGVTVYSPSSLPVPYPVMPSNFAGSRGSTIWTLDATTWELSILNADGTLRARVHLPVPAANRAVIAGSTTPRADATQASIILGEDGRFWIERVDAITASGGPIDWIVLESDGAFVGTARTPAGFFPNQFGADFASGTQYDRARRLGITVYALDGPR